MVANSESFNIFRELGMTTQQTKVYLALSRLQQATVKAIATAAQVDRGEVYRVVPELEKRCLIQKILSNPIVFRAVPPCEAFKILLQENGKKFEETCRQMEQFLQNFSKYNGEKPSKEDDKYCLTTGSKAEIYQYSRDMMNIQTSRDTVADWQLGLQWINRCFECTKQTLERGIKWRWVTNIPEGEGMPQTIQTLTKAGSFEVKFASTSKAGVDIFDKKEVHVITIPNADIKRIEVLRTKNPEIVELVQDFFDIKWQTATEPCWHKKNHQMRT